ncbi:gamma-glutamylcyclotransferase [Salmonella bongori]|uniref:glutathione-specific gamma-glutamylcyclotransferase n=2 Tax=Salmonella bongori TaxID=54736 RepID=A0A0K0HAS5_SALBC|nr:gamma-glutamylcyclotransferase [Salmonella bongori serovar 66:z41:- str. SA19983605]ECC8730919.1 gamma-glutamylcyclotransferase [Salmonella bongori]CCC30705.1 cation transport protein [Salmonella bongori NCTC 12419]ECC8921281.1 gamma-glutamylcyclotransferase [Salmonella bongori]ECC9594873.1 gamma-glutamylcyclotransferase [Salmonella bongori]
MTRKASEKAAQENGQWWRYRVLTRDFLLNADCKTAFGAIEESLFWSVEQRAVSLAATLACRPNDSAVWIFGYGSLMWNPALTFEESCTGTLEGWHRAFCLRLTAGRGTACQPGRMLALKEGGRTTGVAYRLPDSTLEEELTLLWKREMITGCYLPTWCSLTLDDGRTVNALVFIMDPRHPLYESDTRTRTIAPLIAAASGPLGTNAQYLFSLDQELRKLGMRDACLDELVAKVKALLGAQEEQGIVNVF